MSGFQPMAVHSPMDAYGLKTVTWLHRGVKKDFSDYLKIKINYDVNCDLEEINV